MLDVEVLDAPDDAPSSERTRALCEAVAAALDIGDGHVAVEYVEEQRMQELNATHRGLEEPTDVLSFPIDGVAAFAAGPRELGDIVICPQHTADLQEAIVHGMLHLLGMDHETDDGEMLELQRQLLALQRG